MLDHLGEGWDSANRRHFIGGSDARIITGNDEAALLQLWREKRGEVEPEDLSGNLTVQLGVVTEPLNRPGSLRRDKCLFVDFDFRRFSEAHPKPSPVFVDELDAGGSKANGGCRRIVAKVWQPPDEKRARDPL